MSEGRAFEDYLHGEDTSLLDRLRKIADSYYLNQYERDFIRNVLHPPRSRSARAAPRYDYELRYLTPRQRDYVMGLVRR